MNLGKTNRSNSITTAFNPSTTRMRSSEYAWMRTKLWKSGPRHAFLEVSWHIDSQKWYYTRCLRHNFTKPWCKKKSMFFSFSSIQFCLLHFLSIFSFVSHLFENDDDSWKFENTALFKGTGWLKVRFRTAKRSCFSYHAPIFSRFTSHGQWPKQFSRARSERSPGN